MGRNKRTPSMMGIECPTGSHIPVLEAAARAATGLVIEHGAGLYSTPLLARLGCRVLCAEPHPGWFEWARWIYQGKAEMASSLDDVDLSKSSLVFIDGPATERGPLLSRCLTAGVPSIIVHDTDEGDWPSYGLEPRHFTVTAYDVKHYPAAHRTTLWTKHTGVPFSP